MRMTTEDFERYQDENAGYCKSCDQITCEDVEPDAEGYECPECHKETVMGLDNALVLEEIEIVDEDFDEDLDREDEEDSELD